MTRADELAPRLESPEESAEVLSLLRAGAADSVSDYDFEAGLAQHLGAIGAPSAAATAGSQVASGGTLSAKALVAAIGLPIASVSVVAALWLSQGSEPAVNSRSAVVTIEPREPSLAEAPPALPAAATDRLEPSLSDDPAKAAHREDAPWEARPGLAKSAPRRTSNSAAPPPAPQAPSSPEGPATHVILEETAGPGDRAAALREATSKPGPVVDSPEETEAEAEARSEAATKARELAKDRLRREMEQLMEAKRALGTNPKRAVELARRGEQEFPASVLGQERRHVLILALIAVGRLDEARRLAAPYLEQHPDSPFSVRVRAALEGRPKGSRP